MSPKNFMYLFVLLIIVPPSLVNYGVRHWPLDSAGEAGDWIGFWGSYLGSISSVCVAIIVFKRQIEIESRRRAMDLEIRFIEEDKSRSAEFVALSSSIRGSIQLSDPKGSLMNAMHFANQALRMSSSRKMKKASDKLFSAIFIAYRKYEELPAGTALEIIDYNDLQFKFRFFEDEIAGLTLHSGLETERGTAV